MPLFLDSDRSGSRAELNAGNCITIGLVNNMPDAALDATERQFTDLIRAATPNAVVLLKLFALPELPRGEAARSALAERYRDIADALGYAARRLDRDRHRAAGRKPDGRAVLGDLEQDRRLGERPYRFHHLVLSCRACRGIAQRMASSAARSSKNCSACSIVGWSPIIQ